MMFVGSITALSFNDCFSFSYFFFSLKLGIKMGCGPRILITKRKKKKNSSLIVTTISTKEEHGLNRFFFIKSEKEFVINETLVESISILSHPILFSLIS